MRDSPLRSANPDTSLALGDLRSFADGWVLDSEYRQLSPATIALRRGMTDRLLWFLEQKISCCGTMEIRQFLGYVANGHKEPGGRRGSLQGSRPDSERTVRDYYTHLRSLFRWLVRDGRLPASPSRRSRSPSPATTRSSHSASSRSRRSSAPPAARATRPATSPSSSSCWDTGVRAEELCGLRQKDVDLQNGRCLVLGKGNKRRMVCFRTETKRALVAPLHGEERDPGAVIPSVRP